MYSIIYADPPWEYRDKAGTRGLEYGSMTLDQIAALPVNLIASPNCVLFMWAVPWVIAEGAHVPIFKSWGFRPVNKAFTWVKLNRLTSEKQQDIERLYREFKSRGMGDDEFYRLLGQLQVFRSSGHYTRGNTEDCLLGIRGRVQRVDKSVGQVILSTRKCHSAKPPEARDRIVQLYGDLPRIELFGRRRVSGWDVWGNEVHSDISLTDEMEQPRWFISEIMQPQPPRVKSSLKN